jgi:formylglycine-generating enzyme required for sulfatase activity
MNVSCDNAQAYIAWLSPETGRAYRLPSEAECEYACRADTTTRYSFGNAIKPDNANYPDSGLRPHQRGRRLSGKPLGLHNMHGNVWEWIEDDWHENYQGAPIDESAWKDAGAGRKPRLCVLRGGSWLNPGLCRSAHRGRGAADVRDVDIGVRVARTLS